MTTTPQLRRIDKCKSCSAAIVWAKTSAGKLIPIDAAPAADGNIRLWKGPSTGEWLALYRPKPPQGEPLYKSHFATCPDAQKFRRPRAKAVP